MFKPNDSADLFDTAAGNSGGSFLSFTIGCFRAGKRGGSEGVVGGMISVNTTTGDDFVAFKYILAPSLSCFGRLGGNGGSVVGS